MLRHKASVAGDGINRCGAVSWEECHAACRSQDVGFLSKEVENAIIVAPGTESVRGSLTEVGVSILNTKDTDDISTDDDIAAYFQKVKHYHFVISRGSQKQQMRRVDKSMFAKSKIISSEEVNSSLLEISKLELRASGSSFKRVTPAQTLERVSKTRY